ncbi:MAG TPA: hypothetical protein VGE08_26120 [Steroidobacter sp.]|uniref:hypothetical protein n=1 Tax=Steroidobacter sp. TaxID=1978227 RepID=UPI002EDB23BC
MNTSHALSYALVLGAVAALFQQAPARAAECALPDTGSPIITVNPKPFTVPPPSTCTVGGLPGESGGLPGYFLKATRQANITVSGVVVGTLYDRVYCLGTAPTCDSTNTFILATRVRMAATPVNFPARNPNCPLWSGTSNECFEINNFFRNIRGTGPALAASVSYWMGSGSLTGTDPNNSLAEKYLEYTGKTYKGLNQVVPPGASGDRDNGRVMYWADTNIFDPDGVNSVWSPWLFVRQNCPFGGSGDHYAVTDFAIKYWQGGEESQIPTNIQAQAYACKTM